MAIIQALLALISKSAGTILNAIFGWAGHALFGKTTPHDQTLLSGLVGAAVAWPLLALGSKKEAGRMDSKDKVSEDAIDKSDQPALAAPTTVELFKAIGSQGEQLIKAQLALARAELQADVIKEVKMVAGLGVSAIAALIAVNLLLVAAVFALATVMPGWAAGLIVAGAISIIAGVAAAVGWSRRVTNPLARTRHELKEDVKWTKERVA
ncbi:MAG TPA: phage holin family protein [Polyangia bacterium]|jgi:uncharacterized membrane protein YqjE